LQFLAIAQYQGTPQMSAKKVEYTSQNLRDPFKNPFEKEKELEQSFSTELDLSRFQIQGMVWNSDTPQAIINNTVVNIGDVIEDVEIVAIHKEGIYVFYEGREYILRPSIPVNQERGR
jgi:competence CoiA-like predicted nuclease